MPFSTTRASENDATGAKALQANVRPSDCFGRMIDPHLNAHLGYRRVWGGTREFGLSRLDRRQHTAIVGMTGTGKSTFLRI